MHDSQNYPLSSGSAAAVELYNAAVAAFLDYRLSAMETLKKALEKDEQFIMGHVLRGYMLMMMNTSTVHAPARRALRDAKAHYSDATPREKMHVAALGDYVQGDWVRLISQLESLVAEFPLDIIALRVHHFVSFWMGRSKQLISLPASAFPAWSSSIPNYGNVLGMMCFGLEEIGEYKQAEKYGREAVETNPDDLWAVHSVAHVLEMQSRHVEGLQWLDYPLDVWEDRNPFRGHLWWHRGLYLIESGDLDEALTLYDSSIYDNKSVNFLDLQNAAAFLLRLEFLGKDVGDRWTALADNAWKAKGDHQLVFTDVHNVLALARAGRITEARAFVQSMRDYAEAQDTYEAGIHKRLGIPLSEMMIAFEEKDYDSAIVSISQHKPFLIDIGASHAQRDLFSLFAIEVAKRGGKASVLNHLQQERAFMANLASIVAR